MIQDADLLFSDAQAVTAAAASDNYLDLGPLFTGNTGRDIGAGEELWVAVTVDVAMTDGSSDSTLEVKLQTDDNTSFTSASDVQVLGTIPAVQAAGTKFFWRLPREQATAYERYIRLYYTPANGNLSTGSFTAAIVKDVDKWKSYASGYSTGI